MGSAPPLPGLVGSGLVLLFWMLLPCVASVEAQYGRVHFASFGLAGATVSRAAPVSLGLANPSFRAQQLHTWLPWFPLEVGLLLATAAATVAAATSATGAIGAMRRTTAAAANEQLLPSESMSSTHGSLQIAPGAPGTAGPDPRSLDDDDDDSDVGVRPGEDAERVIPRGVSWWRGLRVMHDAHRVSRTAIDSMACRVRCVNAPVTPLRCACLLLPH